MVYRDYYASNSPWYYVLQITQIIYGCGLLANIVLVMNTNVPDTVFKTLPGGTEYNLRYNSFQWTIFMLAGFKYLMHPILSQMILYRRSRGCSIFWFILIFAIALIDFFVVLGLARLYSDCNRSGQLDNPCNSLVWCCAKEIWTVSSNLCMNNGPCAAGFPTTVAELGANVDFVWYFAVSVAFLAFDLFYVGFFGGAFYVSPIPKVVTRKKAEEDGLIGSSMEQGLNTLLSSNKNKMTKGE